MTTDTRTALNEITALVDTYHAERGQMALPQLIELRANMAVWLFRLAATAKEKYGSKALSEAALKHAFAKEIYKAMQEDIAAMRKPRAHNTLEAQAEATDRVLFLRQERARAESEYEDVRAIISATNQVLASLQQEISVLGHEYKNQHHANLH